MPDQAVASVDRRHPIPLVRAWPRSIQDPKNWTMRPMAVEAITVLRPVIDDAADAAGTVVVSRDRDTA